MTDPVGQIISQQPEFSPEDAEQNESAWFKALTAPQTQAGLLQFASSILQPGGFGRNIGNALGATGQAIGRVNQQQAAQQAAQLKVEGEQADREDAKAQQEFENMLSLTNVDFKAKELELKGLRTQAYINAQRRRGRGGGGGAGAANKRAKAFDNKVKVWTEGLLNNQPLGAESLDFVSAHQKGRFMATLEEVDPNADFTQAAAMYDQDPRRASAIIAGLAKGIPMDELQASLAQSTGEGAAAGVAGAEQSAEGGSILDGTMVGSALNTFGNTTAFLGGLIEKELGTDTQEGREEILTDLSEGFLKQFTAVAAANEKALFGDEGIEGFLSEAETALGVLDAGPTGDEGTLNVLKSDTAIPADAPIGQESGSAGVSTAARNFMSDLSRKPLSEIKARNSINDFDKTELMALMPFLVDIFGQEAFNARLEEVR